MHRRIHVPWRTPTYRKERIQLLLATPDGAGDERCSKQPAVVVVDGRGVAEARRDKRSQRLQQDGRVVLQRCNGGLLYRWQTNTQRPQKPR